MGIFRLYYRHKELVVGYFYNWLNMAKNRQNILAVILSEAKDPSHYHFGQTLRDSSLHSE